MPDSILDSVGVLKPTFPILVPHIQLEYHKAKAVVLIVLAFVPHLEFANFFSRLFRVATFILVQRMCRLVARRPVQCYT